MATSDQNLRQRAKESEPTTTTSDGGGTMRSRDKRMAMAKRGLRSLAIAITVPLCLTTASTFFCISGAAAQPAAPFWQPPKWLLHMASLSNTALMGLAAWLVWADGGFRRQPTALPLYLAQFLLGLAWPPLVFRLGAARAGLGVCFVLLLALFGCVRTFKKVNPIAADLVKPCLAWVSLLAIYNSKLV